MPRIILNDAFHRLIEAGHSPQRAREIIVDSPLDFWCNCSLLARDYIATELRIVIQGRNLEVLPAGPLGWAPEVHVFEIDSEQLARLPVMSPGRHDLKRALLVEAQRREREGLPINAGILHRWLEDTFKKVVLPTERGVRQWIADWRRDGQLRTTPPQKAKKRRK